MEEVESGPGLCRTLIRNLQTGPLGVISAEDDSTLWTEISFCMSPRSIKIHYKRHLLPRLHHSGGV